jgi:hypothetical protein
MTGNHPSGQIASQLILRTIVALGILGGLVLAMTFLL